MWAHPACTLLYHFLNFCHQCPNTTNPGTHNGASASCILVVDLQPSICLGLDSRGNHELSKSVHSTRFPRAKYLIGVKTLNFRRKICLQLGRVEMCNWAEAVLP